eukprot:6198832-Alexandrium_andersonii.AAC.1
MHSVVASVPPAAKSPAHKYVPARRNLLSALQAVTVWSLVSARETPPPLRVMLPPVPTTASNPLGKVMLPPLG